MAPGPKKHGSRRSPNDHKIDHKKHFCVPNDKYVEKDNESQEKDIDNFETGDKKYQKRKIITHMNRYDEPVIDHHIDTKLGVDYEVLLSNSEGGAGSQHLLSEEKEWEECDHNLMNLTIDFNYLNESLNCIPFYKRVKLPEETFEPTQINRMNNAAEMSQVTFSNLKIKSENRTLEEIANDSNITQYEENTMIQIEKSSTDDVDFCVESQTAIIPANLENSIESLASSLTSKVVLPIEQKVTKIEVPNTVSDSDNTNDNDLDFLLSLSIGNSTVMKKNESVKPKITNSNVDEWLSNILEK